MLGARNAYGGRFWCNFKKQFPSHEIFNMEARGELCLARTVAVALHGDEGRSRKHSAFLVLNFHSLLGRGLHPAREEQKKRKKKRPYVKQLPNFVGHTYTNRFMFASLRKKDYTENEGVFDALMDAAAEEARFMCTTGVQNPRDGKVYWMVLVAIVGDWPWLHKSGGFGRSFNNVQKRKDQQAAAGICHLCRAGQPEFEFEQLHTRRPTWLQTMYEDDPFTADTPFRRVPHVRDKLPSLWCFDLFHSFHLGVAKNFLGSALALLSEFEAETNIDDRFETLSGRFRSWCQANRCRGHKLSKENIGWPTTGHYPTGTWHKGELTTVLMNWLESRCNSEDFSLEPLLVEVGEATRAIQAFVRTLYKCGAWLSPSQSAYISEQGMRFLRRYCSLAKASKDRGKCLFAFQPKIHVIHHMCIDMQHASQQGISYLSPITCSVQPDEDFIGRPSRLSRRVTARGPVLGRVVSRYLQAAYNEWLDMGLLVRPE